MFWRPASVYIIRYEAGNDARVGPRLALPLTATPQVVSVEKSRMIAKVICANTPSQSYALYLPTGYSADKPSPILYVFDPAARGASAVEAVREAAEKYGYIVVASNNSRNGPQGGASEAVNAIFQDTHQRYAIDERRLYTAGLSGERGLQRRSPSSARPASRE